MNFKFLVNQKIFVKKKSLPDPQQLKVIEITNLHIESLDDLLGSAFKIILRGSTLQLYVLTDIFRRMRFPLEHSKREREVGEQHGS